MNILLLDIDGVLATPAKSFWKPGARKFLLWAEVNFDLVMILSSWRQLIHEQLKEFRLPDFPSLAWNRSKLDGLGHFRRKGHRVVWVEDGALKTERSIARRLGFTLIEVPSDISLADLQDCLKLLSKKKGGYREEGCKIVAM